jgi:hypothetical protein
MDLRYLAAKGQVTEATDADFGSRLGANKK